MKKVIAFNNIYQSSITKIKAACHRDVPFVLLGDKEKKTVHAKMKLDWLSRVKNIPQLYSLWNKKNQGRSEEARDYALVYGPDVVFDTGPERKGTSERLNDFLNKHNILKFSPNTDSC